MKGPHHFAKSENHLALAGKSETGSDDERAHLAIAQIHALLALTAATAEKDAITIGDSAATGTRDRDYCAWRDAGVIS